MELGAVFNPHELNLHLAMMHKMKRSNFSKTLKREFEVAFSKNAQPLLFRVLKYVVLICLISIFWRSRLFWVLLTLVLVLSLVVHVWYRYKTASWTKSYGGWDYEKNKSRLDP